MYVRIGLQYLYSIDICLYVSKNMHVCMPAVCGVWCGVLCVVCLCVCVFVCVCVVCLCVCLFYHTSCECLCYSSMSLASSYLTPHNHTHCHHPYAYAYANQTNIFIGQGDVMALRCFMQTLMGLLAPLVWNYIYAETVAWEPGFAFFVMSGVLFGTLVLSLTMHHDHGP
jgi:hypothetical protein